MGLLAGLIGSSSGMMIVCYTRALRKVPLFSKPWEHVIFGVIGGWWGAHKLLQAESYCEEVAKQKLKAKMDANKGVLDDKYRALLGTSYEKFFPASPSES